MIYCGCQGSKTCYEILKTCCKILWIFTQTILVFPKIPRMCLFRVAGDSRKCMWVHSHSCTYNYMHGTCECMHMDVYACIDTERHTEINLDSQFSHYRTENLKRWRWHVPIVCQLAFYIVADIDEQQNGHILL